MSWQLFILLPVIGAGIGWCTNYLAVRMIFRPRTERRILGLRFQGLLPRRRAELAHSVAVTIERDLLSVDDIQRLVLDFVQGEKVRQQLHERIQSLVTGQIERLGPMVRMFVSDDMISRWQTQAEQEVVRFLESIAGDLRGEVAERLDLRAMVERRIEGFDMDRLEELVRRIAGRELRHIEILGGVLGFLVGLAEALLLLVF